MSNGDSLSWKVPFCRVQDKKRTMKKKRTRVRAVITQMVKATRAPTVGGYTGAFPHLKLDSSIYAWKIREVGWRQSSVRADIAYCMNHHTFRSQYSLCNAQLKDGAGSKQEFRKCLNWAQNLPYLQSWRILDSLWFLRHVVWRQMRSGVNLVQPYQVKHSCQNKGRG